MGLGAAATAGLVAAGVGAAGSVATGLIGSSSAKGAASTQAQAAQQAALLQKQQFDETNANLEPFRSVGSDALSVLRTVLGLPPSASGPNGAPGNNPIIQNGLGSLVFQPTQAQLEQTPGYQFDLSQGLRGVENSASAQGRGLSGAALKGAAQFATGLANNTLSTQQGIFQSNLANILGPISSLASLGENAAAQTGTIGQASSASIGQSLTGAGNALAAGQVGSANALGSGLGGIGSAAQNFALFNALGGSNSNNNTGTGTAADTVPIVG